MKRIIIHWTGGSNQPNATDYEHYHYLVRGDGLVVTGKYAVEDNENCNDGKYAAHTGGGNSGSIGISMCGMAGFESRQKVGNYPLRAVQCERCFRLIAEVAKRYKIGITRQTVMTHYEFGKANPKTTSAGKIDIIYLPPYPEIGQEEAGDFIREQAKRYM